MSVGTGVVGGSRGPIPSFAGEAGVFFPACDASALSDATQRFRSDRGAWHRVRYLGTNRADEFSWQPVVSKTALVHKHVLAGR